MSWAPLGPGYERRDVLSAMGEEAHEAATASIVQREGVPADVKPARYAVRWNAFREKAPDHVFVCLTVA